MDFITVMVLMTSIAISALIIIIYRIFKKQFFSGIHWLFPASPIVGFIAMYFTSDNDTFLLMLKEVLIWAFIISMVYVNIKCLISGSKRTFNSGKSFISEIKKEWKIMKPSFKTKRKESGNSEDGEKD